MKMIIFEDNETVKFITQIEHARLSLRWLEESSGSFPEAVRVATEHHDDGWREYDETPKYRDGKFIDYRSVPLADHLDILARSSRRCAERDPYAGWLVSRHGCSFHESKSHKDVEAFRNRQLNFRETLKTNFEKRTKRDRTRDFNWLQLADAVSLFALDPWRETLKWNRRDPGKILLAPENESRIAYNGPGFPTGKSRFEYRYRCIRKHTTLTQSELTDRYRKAEPKKGTIILVAER